MADRQLVWEKTRSILEPLAEEVSQRMPAATLRFYQSENDAFWLRGYLSIMVSAQGDELAVVVSGQRSNGGIILTSDISMDDGETLGEGPTASIPLSELSRLTDGPTEQWLIQFSKFLEEMRPAIFDRVRKLS